MYCNALQRSQLIFYSNNFDKRVSVVFEFVKIVLYICMKYSSIHYLYELFFSSLFPYFNFKFSCIYYLYQLFLWPTYHLHEYFLYY